MSNRLSPPVSGARIALGTDPGRFPAPLSPEQLPGASGTPSPEFSMPRAAQPRSGSLHRQQAVTAARHPCHPH